VHENGHYKLFVDPVALDKNSSYEKAYVHVMVVCHGDKLKNYYAIKD
jgi:hypothetical protein